MIYVLTIKKHFNQKGIHPTLQIIRSYIYLYGSNDLLICWPGYLSTNTRTANNFFHGFPTPLPKGATNHMNPCFFFNGRNGGKIMTGTSPATNIAKYINGLYNGYSSSYGFKDDHSKIIAFCDLSNVGSIPNGSYLDSVINDVKNGKITVKALLIGSSNHSHNTLTRISPDKKGECDVFMFDGDYCADECGALAIYHNVIENSYKNDDTITSITLSKEIVSSSSLNDIFRQLVEK